MHRHPYMHMVMFSIHRVSCALNRGPAFAVKLRHDQTNQSPASAAVHPKHTPSAQCAGPCGCIH